MPGWHNWGGVKAQSPKALSEVPWRREGSFLWPEGRCRQVAEGASKVQGGDTILPQGMMTMGALSQVRQQENLSGYLRRGGASL